MANQIVGAARFTYTTTSSTGTITVNLGTPLHELETDKQIRTFVSESMDYSQRAVVQITGGQYTLAGDVRFHDDARELVDLIEAGRRGYLLTYFHGSTASGHASRLLEADPVIADRELAGKGYYETRLTLGTASTAGFGEVL